LFGGRVLLGEGGLHEEKNNNYAKAQRRKREN